MTGKNITSETIYTLHYGGLVNKTNNASASFLLYDDFSDSSIDTGIWGTTDETPSATANFTENSTHVKVSGYGSDIWTGQDHYSALYTNISGNFVMTIKEDIHGASSGWSKMGIMIAEDITASGSSAYDAMIVSTASNGYAYQHDSTGNGYIDTSSHGSSTSYPSWLRLKKIGNTLTSYYSTDDTTYTQRGTSSSGTRNNAENVGIVSGGRDAGDYTSVDLAWITRAVASNPTVTVGSATSVEEYTNTTTIITQDSDTGNDTITARGENCGSECAVDAFDRSTSTKWLDFSSTSWITVQLGAGAKRVGTYQICSGNDAAGRDPDDWTIEGSTDGSSWTTIDTVTNNGQFPSRNTCYNFTTDDSGVYSYYKMNITGNNGENIIQLSEIKLFEQTVTNIPSYTILGNHTQDNSYSWNLNEETVGEVYEGFRCKAIDVTGSNNYSNYYTITSNFEIGNTESEEENVTTKKIILEYDNNGNLEWDGDTYRKYNSLNQLYRVFNASDKSTLLIEYTYHPLQERVLIKTDHGSS